MKIATLLPSATEIVAALGMADQLVGISHSCNYPPEIAGLPRVTSTRISLTADSHTIDLSVREHLQDNQALYDLDVAALAQLAPDVIVSQALCDVCAVATGDVVAALNALPGTPDVIDLTPNTLADVFADIVRVGDALGKDADARALVTSLKNRCETVAGKSLDMPAADKPRVVFLEWLAPPFNGGHWNPELVELAGGIDVLGHPGQPSATCNWEQVLDTEPDVVFVACCGLSVERASADIRELADTKAWRELTRKVGGRVYLSDGNAFFSSPGPRLIDGLEVLAYALHPTLHARPAPGLLLDVGRFS